jgi:RimJ/RimL family protein N-acetyltransferase
MQYCMTRTIFALMNAMNWLPTLEDEVLVVRPLERSDREGLWLLASDALVWEQHPAKERGTPEGFYAYFEDALQNHALAVVEKSSSTLIGTSRYHPVEGFEGVVEIGWTLIGRSYWGSEYNRRLKDLMLKYAFLHVKHVVFYVNEHNFRSQKAVEKLGAQRTSTLYGLPLPIKANSTYIYLLMSA